MEPTPELDKLTQECSYGHGQCAQRMQEFVDKSRAFLPWAPSLSPAFDISGEAGKATSSNPLEGAPPTPMGLAKSGEVPPTRAQATFCLAHPRHLRSPSQALVK